MALTEDASCKFFLETFCSYCQRAIFSQNSYLSSSIVSFSAAFIIGIIISATMMSIVQGSVKAVIVCFVDHPHRLYENHPEDTIMLTDAIGLVYPFVAMPVFSNTTV